MGGAAEVVVAVVVTVCRRRVAVAVAVEVALIGVRGNIHNATLSSFKAKLRTFLFSQYFHPN